MLPNKLYYNLSTALKKWSFEKRRKKNVREVRLSGTCMLDFPSPHTHQLALLFSSLLALLHILVAKWSLIVAPWLAAVAAPPTLHMHVGGT
jgi:hypothetical protein